MDILDGTAETISPVAVRPELAVTWTKPVEIDLAVPMSALLNPAEAGVVILLGDGSAHFLSAKNVDSKTLRLLL